MQKSLLNDHLPDVPALEVAPVVLEEEHGQREDDLHEVLEDVLDRP